jgi:serine/threonine protein kinase
MTAAGRPPKCQWQRTRRSCFNPCKPQKNGIRFFKHCVQHCRSITTNKGVTVLPHAVIATPHSVPSLVPPASRIPSSLVHRRHLQTSIIGGRSGHRSQRMISAAMNVISSNRPRSVASASISSLGSTRAYLDLPLLIPVVLHAPHAQGAFSSVGLVHAVDATSRHTVLGAYKIATTTFANRYMSATKDHIHELKLLQFMRSHPSTWSSVVQPIGRFTFEVKQSPENTVRVPFTMGGRKHTEVAIVYERIIPLSSFLSMPVDMSSMGISTEAVKEWAKPHRVTLHRTSHNIADLVTSLHNIHQCGIVHFDIKPGNTGLVPHLASISSSHTSIESDVVLHHQLSHSATHIGVPCIVPVAADDVQVSHVFNAVRFFDWGFAQGFVNGRGTKLRPWTIYGTQFFSPQYFFSSSLSVCSSNDAHLLARRMDQFAFVQLITCFLAGISAPDLGPSSLAKATMLQYGVQFLASQGSLGHRSRASQSNSGGDQHSWIHFKFSHKRSQCISDSHHSNFCKILRSRAPLTGTLGPIWAAIVRHVDLRMYHSFDGTPLPRTPDVNALPKLAETLLSIDIN